MKLNELLPTAQLTELFDTSSELEWVANDDYEKTGYFMINGKKFKIEIYVVDDVRKIWGVVYGNIENEFIRFAPTGQSATDATKVLGTVVNELARFIQEKQPNALMFSGSKGHGLHKLYDLMLRNLSKKVNNMGYRIEHGVDGDSSKFGIVSTKFESFDDIEEEQ